MTAPRPPITETGSIGSATCWQGDRHIIVGQGSYLQYRSPVYTDAFWDNANQIN